MGPKTLPDRVADSVVIEKHKPGLMIEEGTNTRIGAVEKIIFKNISEVPWFGMSKNIAGKVEFYSCGRCFSCDSADGFPNSMQILKEEGQEKPYFALIAGYELCWVYHESKSL